MDLRNVFIVLVSEMGTSLAKRLYDYGEVYMDEKRAAARKDVLREKLAKARPAYGRPFKGEVAVISTYLVF